MLVFKEEYDKMSNQIATTAVDESETRNEASGSGKFIRLRPTALSNEESELTRYLLSERLDLKMLNDFPIIREMFFKYNTQLPSSAPVERMFSFAGILDDPRRN